MTETRDTSEDGNVEVPGDPQAAEKLEARKRVFEALPPEIQKNPQVRKQFGLGDLVELVAKPIAKVIGLPENCLPCQKRKEKLNRVRLWGGRK